MQNAIISKLTQLLADAGVNVPLQTPHLQEGLGFVPTTDLEVESNSSQFADDEEESKSSGAGESASVAYAGFPRYLRYGNQDLSRVFDIEATLAGTTNVASEVVTLRQGEKYAFYMLPPSQDIPVTIDWDNGVVETQNLGPGTHTPLKATESPSPKAAKGKATKKSSPPKAPKAKAGKPASASSRTKPAGEVENPLGVKNLPRSAALSDVQKEALRRHFKIEVKTMPSEDWERLTGKEKSLFRGAHSIPRWAVAAVIAKATNIDSILSGALSAASFNAMVGPPTPATVGKTKTGKISQAEEPRKGRGAGTGKKARSSPGNVDRRKPAAKKAEQKTPLEVICNLISSLITAR